MNDKYKVIKNKLGFFEVSPKPTIEELENHYSEKYYQVQPNSLTYTESYTDSEIRSFDVEAELCEETINRQNLVEKTLLDVGCGEGFFANYFYKKGWEIHCVDFSKDGVERHNKELLEFFEQADILPYLQEKAKENCTYGLINLDNVLEHVLEPYELLLALKKLMNKNSIARIEVPNDFSAFQQMLLDKEITTETWVAPPEHLSYFNRDGFLSILEHAGLELISLQAGFPIELFLLNQHSNYWKNPEVGKAAHFSRVDCTNYLADMSISKFVDFKEVSADLEFGRQFTAYLKLP